MPLKFTLWFGGFALVIGVLTLLARVLKWQWLFSKVDNDNYWELSHLIRYTVVPFGIAAIAFYRHFGK